MTKSNTTVFKNHKEKLIFSINAAFRSYLDMVECLDDNVEGVLYTEWVKDGASIKIRAEVDWP